MSSLQEQGPYGGFAAITPSDTVDIVGGTLGIYVGGAGNLAVVPIGGTSAVVFTAVPVGTILRVRARRVNATLTTATLLVALKR